MDEQNYPVENDPDGSPADVDDGTKALLRKYTESHWTDGGRDRRGGGGESGGGGAFPLTRWTLVVQARQEDTASGAGSALGQLCAMYWRPIYGYVRTWKKSPQDAEDLTQEFFSRLLANDVLAGVDEAKGKLRTFLLVAVKRFLANEHHRDHAQKRGGAKTHIPIDRDWAEDRFSCEPSSDLAPDVLFERRWALTVLENVLGQLRDDYDQAGKGAVFEALKESISGDSSHRPYAEIAADLGISEGAVKVAVHRVRQRYRDILKQQIAQTVESPGDVQDEIRHLLAVFRG